MKEVFPYQMITASGIVQTVKAEMYYIIITCDGEHGYVDLYDGINDTAPQIARVRCLGNRSLCWCLHKPLQLQRGLYVKFGTHVTHVTVGSDVV